jgi:predicted small lipoprotein YifL
MRRLLFATALVFVISGCGQKGPLYLPDKNAKVVTTPAASPPSAPAQSAPSAPATPATPKKSPDDPDAQNPPKP